MGRGGAGALQRQVVLVGAGQAHLDVLRLWGLRKQREATADKTTPCSSAAGAASTDKTAAVVLRSILGKDAAVAADEECSNNSGCINNLPVSSVSLLLVTETTEVLYSAMVPGYITGEFNLPDLTVDLAPLCSFAGASLITARAVGLLPQQKLLLLDGSRPPLRFDVLSIDTGSKPEMSLIPGSIRPLLSRSNTFVNRGCIDGDASTAEAETSPMPSPTGDDSLRGHKLSPCGCPASGSSSSSSSRYCCCCVCPKRPIQGIVSRWLLLQQQLQQAWQQAVDSKKATAGGESQDTARRDSSTSTSSSKMADTRPVFRILVIGGGAVGVEMALALQYAVQQLLQTLDKHQQQRQKQHSFASYSQKDEQQRERSVSPLKVEVVLATSGPEILTGYSKRAQATLRKLLTSRGVTVHVNCRVERLEEMADGRRVLAVSSGTQLVELFDFSFCCTSTKPQDWIQSTRLPLDENGFLRVLPTLQCVDYPSIFAAGHTASIVGHIRPKAGVYAVRAAPVIESNIWRLLRGETLEVWKPQGSFMSLLVTGKSEAALCKGAFVFHGNWVWKLKKAIDSNWLCSHRDFPGPTASPSAPPGPQRSTSFLGLKELGAAAAFGAEALSTWVSAAIASEPPVQGPAIGDLPHPCMSIFATLLSKAAGARSKGCTGASRCAGCSSKIPQRVVSAALQQLRHHNFQVQQLHDREAQLQQLQQQPGADDQQDWDQEKPLFARPEVICGLKTPDDCCLFSPVPLDGLLETAGVTAPPVPLLAQSVDFFRLFTGDLYTMGRVAAAHALSDLYACGAEPLTALAVTLMQKAPPELQANNLLQFLCGASSVFSAEGCELSGGHSAAGDGPSAAGFCVTGRIFYPSPPGASSAKTNSSKGGNDEKRRQQQQAVMAPGKPLAPGFLLRKGSTGVTEGCVLLLTKGIGTGVIFAAHAKSRAKGGWVEAALQQMQQTNRAAMHALVQHGATACTDITGFGLLGHLLEVVDTSNRALAKLNRADGSAEAEGGANLVGARVWLGRIPLLPGAAELTRKGVAASLFVENAATGARRLSVLSEDEVEAEAPLGSLHLGNVRGLSPSNEKLGDERELLQALQQQLRGPCCCRASLPAEADKLEGPAREETAVQSSLWSYSNVNERESSRSCCCCSPCSDSSIVFPLLFDPQTSGGLLAAVPAEAAASCLAALRVHTAAVAIGDIISLPPDAAANSSLTRNKPIQIIAAYTETAADTASSCK